MNDETKKQAVEESLDPLDWEQTRAFAHRVIDDSISHVKNVRDRPLWQDIPQDIRDFYNTSSPPQTPQSVEQTYQELLDTLLPYSMGNIHPRFWMWYMGSGSFNGALAEFLAAIDGSNLGGGNHSADLVDRQVVDWLKSMMGFPASASGTLVSGGSMANIIGLTVARNVKANIDVREEGICAITKPLLFYASDQVHSCHQKAVELLGMGNKALRRVPSDSNYCMDMKALETMIKHDRESGKQPACIIATAGTVNTGAIDDLKAIRQLCDREDMWFHVDGCIGALVSIAPKNKPLVAGIEAADSLALDPHKLLHVPFEAGCALIKDARVHRDSFAVQPEYLEDKPRGIAAADFLQNYNLQTSRAFRALKVWMMIKEHGIQKLGRVIDQHIEQAHYLTKKIQDQPLLELLAPTTVNIVCFRFNPGMDDDEQLKELNTEIMLRLQESGMAAMSDTTVGRQHCLRVAICNHRTRYSDLDILIREVLRTGNDLA